MGSPCSLNPHFLSFAATPAKSDDSIFRPWWIVAGGSHLLRAVSTTHCPGSWVALHNCSFNATFLFYFFAGRLSHPRGRGAQKPFSGQRAKGSFLDASLRSRRAFALLSVSGAAAPIDQPTHLPDHSSRLRSSAFSPADIDTVPSRPHARGPGPVALASHQRLSPNEWGQAYRNSTASPGETPGCGWS
jgi:hypothetical protein